MRPAIYLSNSLSALTCLLFAALLAGCGGQDFGGFQRSLNGDIGNGYNSPLSTQGRTSDGRSAAITGSYPMIETSFQLPSVPGDPFDFEKVNVQVTIRKPGGGTVEIPAFYDGDKTWRARYTPLIPGQYTVDTVRLNREIAHEEKLQPKEWTVKGEPQPGFVRIDRGDHSRFVFDSGGRYYPIGQDAAWNSSGVPAIPDLFTKMHAAGENWSRVWMTHWDGKNLDWPQSGKPAKPGEIDLAAAKKWDEIVQAAEKNDIYFQMVLQHHGQYSTTVDSNWNDNPYNFKNGGFLHAPTEFFNDMQARELTRRKLYYILARWGYSPNIMAFELFNEVQFTDSGRDKRYDDIAMWHKEMSLFIKQYDLNRHLITTSSAPDIPLDNPIWETVDYVQVHAYPSDVISALGNSTLAEDKKLSKPIFVGEFGPSDLKDSSGTALHAGLWASMMHWPSGAAQYWDWENIDKHNLYGQFQSAVAFLTASGLAGHGGLVSLTLPIETTERSDLRFGPGGGFEPAKQYDFVVGPNGAPPGMDHYPAYLQGTNHRAMMPQPLTLEVSYPQNGKFSLSVGQVALAGAHLKVSVDGKAVERDYPAQSKDYTPESDQQILQIDVPQGAHTITVENTGKDWVRLHELTFSNYAPILAAISRAGRDYLAAWIYNRANIDAAPTSASTLKPASGKLTLPTLQPGRYRVTWWDIASNKILDETDIRAADSKSKEAVTVATPSVSRDVAVYVVKLNNKQQAAKTARRTQSEAPSATLSPTTPMPSGAAPTTAGKLGN